MHLLIAPLRQLLRKLWLFLPRQSWAPLPGKHCPRAVSLGIAPLKLPNLLAHTSNRGVLSTLKCGRYKLLKAHGLTLVTPNLRGWEAFSMLWAFIYTSIIWALSPMASQVLSVTPGSPLYPWCCGHSSWRGA